MNSTHFNGTDGTNGTAGMDGTDQWDPATESAVLGVGIGFLLLYLACCMVVARRTHKVDVQPHVELDEFDLPDIDEEEGEIEAEATV